MGQWAVDIDEVFHIVSISIIIALQVIIFITPILMLLYLHLILVNVYQENKMSHQEEYLICLHILLKKTDTLQNKTFFLPLLQKETSTKGYDTRRN